MSDIWLTQGFFDRLFGIFAAPDGRPLLLRNCSRVHGFGLRRPLFLTFLDGDHIVLGSDVVLRPWSVVAGLGASHVLESFTPLAIQIGCRLLLRDPQMERRA